MAGNSSRRGAIRKSKKGSTTGSGGHRRRGLEGKGPTPKAKDRPGHPASRRAARAGGTRNEPRERREVILGRNAVDEALAAGIPAVELAVGDFLTDDVRTTRAKSAAQAAGIPLVVRTKIELDRLADGLPHQGIALLVAAFEYAELHDVIAHRPVANGHRGGHPPLPNSHPIVVVLDHLQDGRNLGAIARSAAAFGVSGLVLPSRRSASVSAAAWRASAGALSRMPVARVVNLARAVASLRKAGYLVVGLSATGGTPLPQVDRGLLDQPVAVVVGSEADGLSRLVAESCDVLATIPIAATTESLNASVATAIALDRLRNP
jgi:23S rRNA (guanosine2251-2'-O)-methyltransferase